MLLTNKLYKEVSLDEYNAAKQVAIDSLALRYSWRTNEQKWDLLVSGLAARVTGPINSTTSAGECIRVLNGFKDNRNQASINVFLLSLPACIKYFEDFYFLYTTEDTKFKLNAAQKAQLLEAIMDAIVTCETGINMRFDMVNQLYRTDLDWVTNCLSKQRYNLVHELHDRFNHEHNVDDVFATHVLKIMLEEAEKAGLGLHIEQSLFDIYENSIPNASKKDVRTYFKQHAPGIFKNDYEDQMVEILTQHLMFEINELYQPVNGVSWDTAGRTLKDEIEEEKKKEIAAFMDFIRDRLGFVGAGGELGDLNDESTEFTLKPKAEFFALLREFVQEKLISEDYYLSIDRIQEAPDSALKSLRLKNGISVTALKEVDAAILACTAETQKACRATLIKHAHDVVCYPDLLLNRAKTNPDLLLLLPKVLTRDAYFLEQAVITVDALLAAAVDDEDIPEQQRLTSLLLRLVRHDKAYLSQCKTTIGRGFFENYIDSKARNKAQAIQDLTQSKPIGFSHTARAAQWLTPDDLIAIIRYRSDRGLSPLPYCHDESGLEVFKEKLGGQRMASWNTEGLAALRRQASECVHLGVCTSERGGDSALNYLANNELWFMAMARYQQANTGSFKTFGQVWFLLRRLIEQFIAVSWEIAKITLMFITGIFLAVLAVIASEMLPPWLVLSVLLVSLSSILLSFVLEDPELSVTARIAGFVGLALVFIDQVIIYITVFVMVFQGISSLSPVAEEFYDTAALFFTRAFAVVYDHSGYTPNIADDALLASDKVIADLAVGGYDDALEKVDALMVMQKKMDSDAASDDALGDYSNKKYSFFYHDAEQQISFNEVVAMASDDDCLFAIG